MKSNNYITATDALYGFVAWLTTRETEITISSHHDAGGPCNLVGEFIKVNNLPEFSIRDLTNTSSSSINKILFEAVSN